MKRILPASLLFAALAVVGNGQVANGAGGARFKLHQLIPEVTLKDGTVLHGVTFVSVGEASITGKWDGGMGSIPLSQLPEAARVDLVPPPPAKTAATVQTPAPSHGSDPSDDSFRLPADIKLTNGFVMRQAQVISWQADAMTVRYVGGQVLVKLENIAAEQRKIFESHKVEVYARQARIDAARSAPRSPSMAGEASAADLQALVQAGIATHQLVAGMTKKEVFQAIGAPARTMTNEQEPDLLYWIYPGRGRNAQGAPCDRIVGFINGVMGGWKDR